MNTTTLLRDGWSWNTSAVLIGLAATAALWFAFRHRARWGTFAAAAAVAVLALMSPLNTLAEQVLFSAHMTQHILLLLIVPALLVLSLPRDVALGLPRRLGRAMPFLGWAAGIGSMYLWHLPALCDAAAFSGAVRGVQTTSLITFGAVFWWPILAPCARDRLPPGHGVLYLFTACLGCTALGVVLTLTPIQVCSAYAAPLAAGSPWTAWRHMLSPERDRQIGGLLMWVPMCSVYVAAIMLELKRWFRDATSPQEVRS